MTRANERPGAQETFHGTSQPLATVVGGCGTVPHAPVVKLADAALGVESRPAVSRATTSSWSVWSHSSGTVAVVAGGVPVTVCRTVPPWSRTR
ncbi:hypothetical protein [Nonomuraea sp. NPDC005501]|uniref:hypothetical protein n=1 Tax=Nonomuraea sp. NPDC005501 TaxID=3156884 RepID=UPI0033BB5817